MDKEDSKIIYFKHTIDNDKFKKYKELINKYINSKYYDQKNDTYFIEFINTYKRLEAEDKVDDNLRHLRNYIIHKRRYDHATEHFTKNLKYYMRENNKTVSDISKDLNIAYSTVSDWYNGKKYPRIDKITLLADYFNINNSDLTEEQKRPNGSVIVPVLGNIPAGIPIEAIEDITDYEEIPQSWLTGDKEYFGLKIKGKSMYPNYMTRRYCYL